MWRLKLHLGTAQCIPIFLKPIPSLHRRLRVDPHAHSQHIKVLKHLIHSIWMWDAVHGGLEPQPSHDYNITWVQPYPTPLFLKSIPELHRHNSVRGESYAHSQHIKVLKHFIYIWYGCGMQSMGVWNLNHHITTSLGLSPTPIFLKSTPNLHRHNSVYAHPQHIKVLKHFVYTWYGCGMQSMGVWSLNHHITTSLGLSLLQFSYPSLTCTGITV